MTETRIITCDRCSARIVTDRTQLINACGPLLLSHPSTDLCGSCSQVFIDWLAEYRAENGGKS